LREWWSKLLGPVEPAKTELKDSGFDGVQVQRRVLETEPGIVVPMLLLVPKKKAGPLPVVVGLAQDGKKGFLKYRSAELSTLLSAGVMVALPDVRGTGESRTGEADLSPSVQLFGETLLGQRLRDLRSVLAYLRNRPEVDGKRIALWGEGLMTPSGADANLKIPRRVDEWPAGPDALGGLLALLGGLFDDDIRAAEVSHVAVCRSLLRLVQQ
jgi:hypothetical protein